MSTRIVQNYINQMLTEEEAARPVGHYSNGGKKEERPVVGGVKALGKASRLARMKDSSIHDLDRVQDAGRMAATVKSMRELPIGHMVGATTKLGKDLDLLQGDYGRRGSQMPTLTGSQLGKARMGGMKAAGSLTVDSITKKYKAARKQIPAGVGGSIFQTEQTEEEERRGAAAGTVAAGSAGAGIAVDRKATGIKTTRDTARAASDAAKKKASGLSDQLADAMKASRIPDPGDKWIGAGKNPIFSGEGPYSPQAYFDNPNIEDYDKPRTTPQRDAMQDLFNKFSDENRLNRQGLRQTGYGRSWETGSRRNITGVERHFTDNPTYRELQDWGSSSKRDTYPTYETSPDRQRVSKMGDEYRDAIRNAPDTPDVAAARAAAGKADAAADAARKTSSAATRKWHGTGKVLKALGPVGAGLSIPFNYMQGKEYGKGLVDTGDRTSKLEKEAGLQGREVKPSPFSPYNKDSIGTKAKDAASAALQGTKQNIKDIGKDYSKTDAILDVATLGNWSGVQALGRQFGVMDDALMKDRVTDLDNTTRTASPDGPVTQAERRALVTQRTGQEDDVSRRIRNARIRRKNAPEVERKAMGY